jgi:hypothetical protein
MTEKQLDAVNAACRRTMSNDCCDWPEENITETVNQ